MIIYKITNSINFIKTLTILRIWNDVKVIFSFYISRIIRKPLIWGYPISISIEPTNKCNLGCTECPTGLQILSRHTGDLRIDLFKKIIDDIYLRTAYLTLYFQGEPYMNKQFFDFVKYASSKSMYVTTSSNAHYLNEINCIKTIESGLSRLIISLDGTTQNIYEQYRRGGNLNIVLEGTKRLVEMKKKMNANNPQVVLQFIVFKQNEHQVEDVKQMAKDLDVDKLALKTAQVYNYEKATDIIPDNVKYSRYQKKPDGTYDIKNKYYNHCWRSWQSCVITWDGYMIPCCFDKDASHITGNVVSKPLIEIWKNDTSKIFKQNLLSNRKDIDICQNCTEGTQIWI